MKTLVIHPKDTTTDFLSVIYADMDCTVTKMESKWDLKEQIKNHDRIIMLGHGSENGLFDIERENNIIVDFTYVIDSTLVYLLREKECVCIWCNANKFVEKYELKGFYTGMIISEYNEAILYCINTDSPQIEYSNTLFAESVKKSIGFVDSSEMMAEMKKSYTSTENPVILFNIDNLFSSSTPSKAKEGEIKTAIPFKPLW